jgi:hypothetical protein
MARIAFGQRQFDDSRSVFTAVSLVLAELPKRLRLCASEIIMRGSSAEFEEWIVLEVRSNDGRSAQSCLDWVAKQVTRQGFAIVPMDQL